jgi:DNA-binding response OmpR family regulator
MMTEDRRVGLRLARLPEGGTRMNTKTVLLVDDDPVVLTLMRRVLEKAGYRVCVASDGNKGLALAERETPDLIVVDLLMAPTSGLQLIEKLKTFPQAPARVIMITASDADRPQAHALKLGVADYIRKPIVADQFLATVQRVCPLSDGAPSATPDQ